MEFHFVPMNAELTNTESRSEPHGTDNPGIFTHVEEPSFLDLGSGWVTSAGSSPVPGISLILKGLEAMGVRVDTQTRGMHDKSMTTRGRRLRKRGPFAQVKHGSAMVPIYHSLANGRPRFTVAFYQDKHRVRRTFGDLESAKREARLAAQRIQTGLGQTNDLRPQERESYLAAANILRPLNVPLVLVADEYAKCRQRLGDVPLLTAVDEFLRRTRDVRIGVKVPDMIEEFLQAKAQDQASESYLIGLRQTLRRFATAFPGEILHIQSNDIDRWLRSYQVSPVTRNSMLRCVKVFFSFAKTCSYLPRTEASAAELVSLVKTGDTTTEIFQPNELQKILLAAPRTAIPVLAIGGFAGLRAAEIERLDWSAVDLERRIITLRADQAKTASRRIVPISDNLFRWLEPLPRVGKVIPTEEHFREALRTASKVGVKWPHNGLRHSYISYRVALISDVNKVALEAGNSPTIIFKNYRELVTEDAAREWFSIVPPDGWVPIMPEQKSVGRRRNYC